MLFWFCFHLACWIPGGQSALRLPGKLSAWPPIHSPQTRNVHLCCRAALCQPSFYKVTLGKKMHKDALCCLSAGALHSLGRVQIMKGKRNPVLCYKASLWGSPSISEGQRKNDTFISLSQSPFNAVHSGEDDKEGARAVVIKVKETTQWNSYSSLCPFFNQRSFIMCIFPFAVLAFAFYFPHVIQ